MTVDVAGKVRRPGIVVLDAGARVVDALEAAGGPAAASTCPRSTWPGCWSTASRSWSACRRAEPGAAAAAVPAPAAPGGPLVNLNTADPGRAGGAARGRAGDGASRSWPGATEHGGFTAVDELLEVDGIGDATLAQIAPHVTV